MKNGGPPGHSVTLTEGHLDTGTLAPGPQAWMGVQRR